MDLLKADLLYLLLRRKSVSPDRLNPLGVEDRFDLILVFIFEADVTFLCHQDGTHVHLRVGSAERSTFNGTADLLEL